MVAAAESTPESRPFLPADWGLLLTSAGIWGASFLFIAIALDAFEPGLITWLRVLFGWATLAVFPQAWAPIDRADRGRVVLLGLIWMAFPFTMFPLAQQWIDSSITGMLNSAMPITTILVGALGYRTPVIRTQAIGVGIGLVGVVAIGAPTATGGDTNALGVTLVLAAVASYGWAANLNVGLQQKYGALPVLLRASAVASLLCAPLGLFGGIGSSFELDALGACAFLGIGGSGLAYVAAGTLGGRVGALRMSLVTYLIPVVAVVLGVLFRDESVQALAVAGTVVVLGGAWIATRSRS